MARGDCRQHRTLRRLPGGRGGYSQGCRVTGGRRGTDEPLPDDGMLDLIASPEERARLRELATGTPGTSWDRLLFSAKESQSLFTVPVSRQNAARRNCCTGCSPI